MAADTQPAEQQPQALLVELLQLDDAATLDFGIYRLLHKRQAELRGLLESLTAGVEPHLQKLAGDERTNALAQRKAVVNRLNDAGKELEELMSHPDYLKADAALRDAADPAVLKHEVFRDLLTFFGRYWDDGDFIAAPRYHHAGHPPYAVPYHGEEVTLYWANRDQYYVKWSLFFNDLVVKESTLPGRLKLKLVNAPYLRQKSG